MSISLHSLIRARPSERRDAVDVYRDTSSGFTQEAGCYTH